MDYCLIAIYLACLVLTEIKATGLCYGSIAVCDQAGGLPLHLQSNFRLLSRLDSSFSISDCL